MGKAMMDINEKGYVLIEKIECTGEGSRNYFRYLEPNGKRYAYTKVLVCYHIAQATANGYLLTNLYFEGGGQCSIRSNDAIWAASPRYFYHEFIGGNVARARSSISSGGSWSATNIIEYFPLVEFGNKKVGTIDIQPQAILPAGSEIWIYAMR